MINSFFFNNTIRKYVITFGNVFNNIKVQHGNGNIVGVPIRYITKEKFVDYRDNDNEDPNVQVILPMLAYDLTNLSYDPTRKTNTIQNKKSYKDPDTGKIFSILNQVPINLDFELNIHTRYEIEMLQIVEQILPFFQPAFNVMIKALPEMGILKTDIPIIHTGTTINNDYIGDDKEIRHLTWVLTFTMRAWLYTNIDKNSNVINRVLIDFGVMGPDSNQSYEGIEIITDPIPVTEEDDYEIIDNNFTIDDFENP